MIETKLRDEIENGIDALGKVNEQTDDYKVRVDNLVKLMDTLNDIEKNKIEINEKDKDREIDLELKLKQMEEEKRDRFNKNCIAVAGIIIPTVVTIWGVYKTWKFEENGTISSSMGRLFMNGISPKRLN